MADDREATELHAELLRLADALLEEVRAAREESARLLEVLDEAVAIAPPPARSPGEPAAASPPAPHPAGDADAVRAMVLEMARTGHSRSEVETYVNDAFGLRVPRDLLDGVFGPQPARGTGAR